MSKKPIDFLEDLRREFQSVCDTSFLGRGSEVSATHVIDLAWCYYFGSPSYRTHLSQTYTRNLMNLVHEVVPQVKIFIETIKRFHSNDEFNQLTSAYCQSIEENRVVLSVESLF